VQIGDRIVTLQLKPIANAGDVRRILQETAQENRDYALALVRSAEQRYRYVALPLRMTDPAP
jgi:hypothetical protein